MMPRVHGLMLISGAVVTTALSFAGCFFDPGYDDCSLFPGPGCGTSSTTSSTTGTGGNDGGTGGGKPQCDGDPSGKNVVDDCGVFAQADAAPGGDGSQAKPFAKLADAIAEAQSTGKRVYACAGAPFAEAVTISAGIELYGGFDCASGWAWSQDARTVLNGPADTIALTIQGSAEGAKVEGLAITAASPSDMKGGGSSIAVAVDDVAATIERCDVKASDAADGVDGVTPSDPVTKGTDAPPPEATTMNACISQFALMGGMPGTTSCDDGDSSGGLGGTGGIPGTNNGDGVDGADGTPAGNTNHGPGASGVNDCADGTKGKKGDAGPAGPGGSELGDVLSLAGIANGDTTDGQTGTKAQGGGGGGGEKAGTFCQAGPMTVIGVGASGGGGGGGGCGGKGGGGGKAGGSSIAIVSAGNKLVLTEVTIAVGKAGKGGSGAAGQSGGAFGHGSDGGAASGISPSKAGCKGGDGGTGGDGGPGGGGRGGHALGIVYASAPSAGPALKMFTPGTPGDGGAAGSATGNGGAMGNAGQCWDFMANAACK